MDPRIKNDKPPVEEAKVDSPQDINKYANYANSEVHNLVRDLQKKLLSEEGISFDTTYVLKSRVLDETERSDSGDLEKMFEKLVTNVVTELISSGCLQKGHTVVVECVDDNIHVYWMERPDPFYIKFSVDSLLN